MAEKQKKPDRRVLKTKRAIRKAFISLLLAKDYNKITIKDIATVADVDRKTVYNYYSGIYEIREELENDIIKSLDEITSEQLSDDFYAQTLKFFKSFNNVVEQNADLFGYLFKVNSQTRMLQKFTYFIRDKITALLLESSMSRYGQEKLQMIASFFSAGSIIVYQTWFLGGKTVSLEVLSEDLTNLVMNGINSFKGSSDAE